MSNQLTKQLVNNQIFYRTLEEKTSKTMEIFVIKTLIKMFPDTCQVLQLKASVTVKPFRVDQTFAELERLTWLILTYLIVKEYQNGIENLSKVSSGLCIQRYIFQVRKKKKTHYFIQIRNIGKTSIFLKNYFVNCMVYNGSQSQIN